METHRSAIFLWWRSSKTTNDLNGYHLAPLRNYMDNAWACFETTLRHLGQLWGNFGKKLRKLLYNFRTTLWQLCDNGRSVPLPCGQHIAIFSPCKTYWLYNANVCTGILRKSLSMMWRYKQSTGAVSKSSVCAQLPFQQISSDLISPSHILFQVWYVSLFKSVQLLC